MKNLQYSWSTLKRVVLTLSIISVCIFARAEEVKYTANFRGTDIQEFITTVGKNLNKTIILDPSVRGKVDVRSYDLLTEEQYFQFFLSVLQVYGYAVVEMPESNVIKVIRDKEAKDSNIPLADDDNPGVGDEMVTRIVPLYNVEAKQLAPLLRQLNNNSGGGNVVNYDPSNVLMITGRAAVVSRLVNIVRRVDLQGDTSVTIVPLRHASAVELVRIVESLTKNNNTSYAGGTPKVVADERINSVIISGDERARERTKELIMSLDKDVESSGNVKVIYLKYAKAEEIADLLSSFSDTLVSSDSANSGNNKNYNINIVGHAQSNSLVIHAQNDHMRAIESVIRQLDIRRAQVLVEAIIVDIQEGDDVGLGVQWATPKGGLIQFGNNGVSASEIGAGVWAARDQTIEKDDGTTQTVTGSVDTLAAALSKVNGMAWGVFSGDFGVLIQAVSQDSTSNILATPSIATLDNQEASFVVGSEVPIKTGSTAGSDNVNPFTTVDRKEVGIKLKVTPQINEGNAVQLTIEQEVSDINGSTSVDVTFAKRHLSTTILADSGETVVLGGLLQDQITETEYKVPWLGDIPLIGNLFSSVSSKKTKRNLMVFIKPTIIRDTATQSELSSRKYNYLRAVQLEQQKGGIKLMPGKKPPVLDEWIVPDGVSPEIKEALRKKGVKIQSSDQEVIQKIKNRLATTGV